MKKSLLVGIALAAVTTFSVMAAELKSPVFKAPPPFPPAYQVYSWTGCSFGGRFGGGWASTSYSDPSSSPVTGNRGSIAANNVVGGGQVGCDYQSGPLVFGIQGMFDGADISGRAIDSVDPAFVEAARVRWFGTLTGRIGYTVMPSALLYVKGGGAWVHDRYDDVISATNTVDASADHTRSGWTVGMGGEYSFAPNWSTFVEYNYLDFGTGTVAFTGSTAPFSFQVNQHIQAIEVGFNYRFNFAMPTPARY